VSITCARTLADVLVLYPSVSLRGQMDSWSQRHPERLLKMSFERSLPEIRKLLRRTETAMIDATADSARAVDAFLQAAAHLGTDKVAVYTEAMHDDLEVFIRARGALLLFGPLFEGQWEEFLGRRLRPRERLRIVRPPEGSSGPAVVLSLEQGRRRLRRGPLDWPQGNTGAN